MVAFHWYWRTDPTVMLVLAAAVVLAVQDPSALPHFTQPVTDEVRAVAQLTVTDPPTRSVRYGYRVSGGLGAPRARSGASDAAVAMVSTASATVMPFLMVDAMDRFMGSGRVRSGGARPAGPGPARTCGGR
jgi:hypothetical protein